MDTSIIQALRDPRFRQDIKGNARDLAQSASNSIAEGVSVPVDALAWALRKAGVNVPSNPLLGSDWMAQQGLTREVQQGLPKVAGETLGLLAPLAGTREASAKIAGGLNQMAENAAKPRMMNPQAGAIIDIFHGTTPEAAAKIEKKGFDLKKAYDGGAWFTTNPNIGEVGAQGKGAIVKRTLDDEKLKLGGWKEYDKLLLDQMISQGFDGVALPDGAETVYKIWNHRKLGK